MMRLALALVLVTACGKDSPTKGTSEPATKATSDPANPKATADGKFALALGDATVYELVDRRWNKREKPSREFVLHPDGKVEMFNDKTGDVMMTMVLKPDGTVLVQDKPMVKIGEHAITSVEGNEPLPVSIDGDTVTVTIEGKAIKVVLAADGNITVVDRPDGNKWRIDAKDPAVMRTAFRVLAIEMETALD